MGQAGSHRRSSNSMSHARQSPGPASDAHALRREATPAVKPRRMLAWGPADREGIVKEEQFGPVIPVFRYDTIDEAIRRANSLEVGLGGSIWGDDPEAATRYAGQLECGTAWVNQHGVINPMTPFGGVKCSGIGVEFGVDGLKEYTTVQALNIAR